MNYVMTVNMNVIIVECIVIRHIIDREKKIIEQIHSVDTSSYRNRYLFFFYLEVIDNIITFITAVIITILIEMNLKIDLIEINNKSIWKNELFRSKEKLFFRRNDSNVL